MAVDLHADAGGGGGKRDPDPPVLAALIAREAMEAAAEPGPAEHAKLHAQLLQALQSAPSEQEDHERQENYAHDFLATLTTRSLEAIAAVPRAAQEDAQRAQSRASSACVRHARAFAAVAAARTMIPPALNALENAARQANQRVPRIRREAEDFTAPAWEALQQRSQLAHLATAIDVQAAPLLELPALVDLAASQGRIELVFRLAKHLAQLVRASAPGSYNRDGLDVETLRDRDAGAAVLRALTGTVATTLGEVETHLLAHLSSPTPSLAPARRALSRLSQLSFTTRLLAEAVDLHRPAAGVSELSSHLRALHVPVPALALAYARTQYAHLSARLEALPPGESTLKGRAASCSAYLEAFREGAAASLRLAHALFLAPEPDASSDIDSTSSSPIPAQSLLHSRAIFSSLAETWATEVAQRVDVDIKSLVRASLQDSSDTSFALADSRLAFEAAHLLADLHRQVRYLAVPLRPFGVDPLPRIAAGSLAQAPRKMLQTQLGWAQQRLIIDLSQPLTLGPDMLSTLLDTTCDANVKNNLDELPQTDNEEASIRYLSRFTALQAHHNAVLNALEVLGTYAPLSTQAGTQAALLSSLEAASQALKESMENWDSGPFLASESETFWSQTFQSWARARIQQVSESATESESLINQAMTDLDFSSEADFGMRRVLARYFQAKQVRVWIQISIPRLWQAFQSIFALGEQKNDGQASLAYSPLALGPLLDQALSHTREAQEGLQSHAEDKVQSLQSTVEGLFRAQQEAQRVEAEHARKEAEARLEQVRQEKIRAEEERIRRGRIEKERLERLEQERLEQERLEKERLERERLERERLEQERLERERVEKERLEQERLEKERLEKERLEQERLDKERLDTERLERDRLEQERLERERFEKERLEQEHLEQEHLEKERLEQERLEQERLEQERLEQERLKQEHLDRERLKQDHHEKERAEKERLEQEQREGKRLVHERQQQNTPQFASSTGRIDTNSPSDTLSSAPSQPSQGNSTTESHRKLTLEQENSSEELQEAPQKNEDFQGGPDEGIKEKLKNLTDASTPGRGDPIQPTQDLIQRGATMETSDFSLELYDPAVQVSTTAPGPIPESQQLSAQIATEHQSTHIPESAQTGTQVSENENAPEIAENGLHSSDPSSPTPAGTMRPHAQTPEKRHTLLAESESKNLVPNNDASTEKSGRRSRSHSPPPSNVEVQDHFEAASMHRDQEGVVSKQQDSGVAATTFQPAASTMPREPSEPTEPTELTDPTESKAPFAPTTSTEPVGAREPTESNETSETAASIEPNKAAEPTQSGKPTDPTGTSKQTEAAYPEERSTASEPEGVKAPALSDDTDAHPAPLMGTTHAPAPAPVSDSQAPPTHFSDPDNNRPFAVGETSAPSEEPAPPETPAPPAPPAPPTAPGAPAVPSDAQRSPAGAKLSLKEKLRLKQLERERERAQSRGS